MLALETFIPLDRRRALASGDVLPDRTQGVALFADVTGFSKLTARLLAHYGDGGAEAVLEHINPLYDAIIDVLHQHGGSAIGFAGDSITCWLDQDDGTRAIACARDMQHAMAQLPDVIFSNGERFALGLKISVASGPVRRFRVGSAAHRYVDVLAGDTLTVMAQGEKYAGAGDIIIAKSLHETHPNLAVAEWFDNHQFARLENLEASRKKAVAELTPATHRFIHSATSTKWLLDPIAERIKTGDYLAELRTATALFLRFQGIDFDGDDAAGEKLDQFTTWVQSVLDRTNGYLLQISIGDKGSYFYASFGAPTSFSDNTHNALHAAHALLAAMPHFDFLDTLQIGVSQGQMWTGAYGGRRRSTYGVLGHHANMAARLMSNAMDGQILIDETIRPIAATHFHIEALPPITVKGHEGPMPIWALHGRKQATFGLPTFDIPLFGRAQPLEQLQEAWQATLAGRGSVVEIVGEAGIGKSHLSSAFVQSARQQAGRIGWAAGDHSGTEAVYAVWRRLLTMLLQLETGDDNQLEKLQQVLREYNMANDERLPLLGDILDMRLPDNATTAAFEPQIRRETLFAFVITLLHALAQRSPLLLVVDDVHWIDEISAELLREVMQQSADFPIMLLLSRRPEGFDWATLATESIALNPLQEHAVAEIAESRLAAAVSPLLDDLLVRLTGGNPFFIESLLVAMQNAEQIVWHAQSWRLAEHVETKLRDADLLELVDSEWRIRDEADLSTAQLGLPDSIRHTVLARIDQLDEHSKLALKIASVIGLEFKLPILSASFPAQNTPGLLERDLNYLDEQELISALVMQLYRFRHQATQEVAYNTLLFAQRQTLHQQVALALERLQPDAIEALAHHAYEGQLWALALRAHVALGESAQRRYANHQSVASYRKALVCVAHSDMKADNNMEQKLRLSLSESLIQIGRYDEAREQLELVAVDDERALAVQAHRWMGRSYELQGNYPEAMRWLTAGITLDEAQSRQSAEMLALSGLIETRRGNFDSAETLCEQALGIVADAPSIRGRIFNLLGIIARLRGNGDQALNYFERSLKLYRSNSDRHGEALALNQLAVANAEYGSWQVAVEHYQSAEAIFVQTGDSYHQLLVSNNLGNIARDQGRLDDALEAYRAALGALQQAGGSPYVKGALHLNLGATYTLRGELVQAQAEFVQSKQLFDSAEVRDLLPELYRYQALAAVRENSAESAEQYAEQSLALARELKMQVEEGHTLRVLGVLHTDDLPRAESYFNDALTLLEEAGDPYGLAKTQLRLAELYAKQHQAIQAIPLLKAAASTFEKLAALPDFEKAQLLLTSLK